MPQSRSAWPRRNEVTGLVLETANRNAIPGSLLEGCVSVIPTALITLPHITLHCWNSHLQTYGAFAKWKWQYAEPHVHGECMYVYTLLPGEMWCWELNYSLILSYLCGVMSWSVCKCVSTRKGSPGRERERDNLELIVTFNFEYLSFIKWQVCGQCVPAVSFYARHMGKQRVCQWNISGIKMTKGHWREEEIGQGEEGRGEETPCWVNFKADHHTLSQLASKLALIDINNSILPTEVDDN